MDFKNHIAFRADDSLELVEYLEANGIDYNKGEIVSALDILESDPHWESVSKIIGDDRHYITETVFSKEEMRSAEWLNVRSVWRYDYPQPENKYREITYNGQMCPECWGGLAQIEAFRFKRAPKWGKRFFLTTNWEDDILFVSDQAKAMIESAKVSGVTFREVKNKSGTETFPDIHQLVVHNILPEGLVWEDSCVDEILVCDKCGRSKFAPNGRGQFVFRKNTFDNAPDIVLSSEFFGRAHYNQRLLIVSQKIYQMIIKNKMDRSLEFEPIKLI
jgi:hypothetical protein